jgi:outer membrane receptor for ferrienterochelin and colicins
MRLPLLGELDPRREISVPLAFKTSNLHLRKIHNLEITLVLKIYWTPNRSNPLIARANDPFDKMCNLTLAEM